MRFFSTKNPNLKKNAGAGGGVGAREGGRWMD